MLAGLTTQAVLHGQATTFAQLLIYYQGNWQAWVIANTLAPMLAAALAAIQTKGTT